MGKMQLRNASEYEKKHDSHRAFLPELIEFEIKEEYFLKVS